MAPRSRKAKSRSTGSYALVLRLSSRRRIMVGKSGLVEFPRGHYIYFGSALGGLTARLDRHPRHDKRLHWHADYLSAEVRWEYAWKLPDGQRWECVWAASDAPTDGMASLVRGFGSSECRCPSYLVRVNNAKQVRVLLRSLSPAPRRKATKKSRHESTPSS